MVKFTYSLMLSFYKLHFCGKEYTMRYKVNLLLYYIQDKKLSNSIRFCLSLYSYNILISSLVLETNKLF